MRDRIWQRTRTTTKERSESLWTQRKFSHIRLRRQTEQRAHCKHFSKLLDTSSLSRLAYGEPINLRYKSQTAFSLRHSTARCDLNEKSAISSRRSALHESAGVSCRMTLRASRLCIRGRLLLPHALLSASRASRRPCCPAPWIFAVSQGRIGFSRLWHVPPDTQARWASGAG